MEWREGVNAVPLITKVFLTIEPSMNICEKPPTALMLVTLYFSDRDANQEFETKFEQEIKSSNTDRRGSRDMILMTPVPSVSVSQLLTVVTFDANNNRCDHMCLMSLYTGFLTLLP